MKTFKSVTTQKLTAVVKKVIYLAIEQVSKKWMMPMRNWKTALNRFMIEFEDRLKDVF